MDEKELAEIIEESLVTNEQMMDWLKQSDHNEAVQRWWMDHVNFFAALETTGIESIRTGDIHKELTGIIKMAFTFGCYVGWNESR